MSQVCLQPKQSLDSQDGRQCCAVWNKGLFAKGPRNTTTGQRPSTSLVQKGGKRKAGCRAYRSSSQLL